MLKLTRVLLLGAAACLVLSGCGGNLLSQVEDTAGELEQQQIEAKTAEQQVLDWYTVDAGGSSPTAVGEYTLGGTTGQPDVGQMSVADYSLSGGFWRPADSVRTAP